MDALLVHPLSLALLLVHKLASARGLVANVTMVGMTAPASVPAARFLLFYADGCQGSTAMMTLLGKLLRCVGVTRVVTREYEYFKPEKNPRFQAALSRLHDPSKAWPAALHTINASLPTSASLLVNVQGSAPLSQLGPLLQRYGVRTAAAYRKNRLDWATCAVRDCFGGFGKAVGHPVLDGHPSSLCFARRHSNVTSNGSYQAHFDRLDRLKPTLLSSYAHSYSARLLQYGLGAVHAQTYEDLAAAQHPSSTTNGDLSRSVAAWQNVLADLVPHAASALRSRVRSCLEPLEGTHQSPGPQRKDIHNFDALAAYVRESVPAAAWMLRP
jgi:hypothetical protein